MGLPPPTFSCTRWKYTKELGIFCLIDLQYFMHLVFIRGRCFSLFFYGSNLFFSAVLVCVFSNDWCFCKSWKRKKCLLTRGGYIISRVFSNHIFIYTSKYYIIECFVGSTWHVCVLPEVDGKQKWWNHLTMTTRPEHLEIIKTLFIIRVLRLYMCLLYGDNKPRTVWTKNKQVSHSPCLARS